MDPRRFDTLARSLAAPKSRRGLLGSLAALAALAASMIGGRSAEAQVSQAFCGNAVCRTNPGVCKPGCVCCVYSNGNSRCIPPGTCTGTVTSPTPTTTTTAAPIPVGGECASAGQCASGVCCEGGPSAGLCGLADGSECWSGGNDACCSGACVEGFCVQPGGVGARCDDDGDCLSGLMCCDNLATIGNDFTCRDPNTDVQNCGECLNFCALEELCELGSCI